MHEPKQMNSGPPHSGHETSDADVGALAKFGIGLAVLCAVALALMFAMLSFFEGENARTAPPPSPLAAQRGLPPGPRLQVLPEKDMAHLQAAEDSVLNSFGWVMREAGIVRIPIDRALELTAQRGLPARAVDRGSQLVNGGSRP